MTETNFEQICKSLNINWKFYEEEFKDRPWKLFQDALRQRAIRTWSCEEAFLAWLLVIKFKPRAILELGAQHGHSGLIWLDAAKKIDSLFVALELGDDPRNKYPIECIGTMQFLEDSDNLVKIWGEASEELPNLLKKYDIDLIFHDCAHTWDHVENCVSIVENFDKNIIQTCHDCGEGMWKPERETQYGIIHAERPVFDNRYLKNPNLYYAVLEDKYGFGLVIPKERIHQEISSE